MRLAIYVQDMRASGVVGKMIALARHCTAEGDAATLVAGDAGGLFGAADVAPAGFVAALPRPPRRLPRLLVVPQLRRTLRQLSPDVVVSGGNFGHFTLWAATRGLGVPVVYVFSNAMERRGQGPRNRWRRWWSGLLIADAARAVVVGTALGDSPTFAGAVARGRAVVIRNGIDASRAAPRPGEVVPAAMAGADPVVLSIGRLQPQKNFGALIDAVAAANAERRLRLVILGTGAEAQRNALLARAAARGIADRVTLAGVTGDVFPWLRAARVFALASHWEGSSNALLEALAAGTPVVVSRSAGDAADVLAEGRYGQLVDPDDAGEFAAALLRQLDDPVRPGDRIAAFTAETMLAEYRAVIRAAGGG